MKFSLVLATVDRVEEPRRFLESLGAQGGIDFELAVVDQNPDDRLEPVLRPHVDRFPIRHLRAERGLSRARNAALRHLTGDIVGFPDDDCRYPPGFLAALCRVFASDAALGGVTGSAADDDGRASLNRWARRRSMVTRAGVWTRATSCTMFLRRDAMERAGAFDETLGLGSGTAWGSGEETDLLLRAIAAGVRIVYDPTLCILHPQVVDGNGYQDAERAASYARGMGRVLRLHRYPPWQVLYHLARPAGGLVLALAGGKHVGVRYHRMVLAGRLAGLTDRLPG